MKSILTVVLLVFLGTQGQAASSKKGEVEPMTFYKMVKMFSKQHADQLPSIIKNDELTHFHAKGNRMSFRWRGIYMRLDFVGRERAVFLFNGRAFSFNDISSSENIRKALKNKFALIPGRRTTKRAAQIEARSQASLDAVSVDPFASDLAGPDVTPVRANPVTQPYDRGESDQAQRNGVYQVHFESLVGRQPKVYDIFPDDSPENNTVMGVGMQSAFDTMSGPYQAGMISGLDNWLGGFNRALGISRAPGESSMDAFMGYNQFNPNNIAKPWEK